jgi:hypothetical protein
MLTKDDLGQIRTLLREEVPPMIGLAIERAAPQLIHAAIVESERRQDQKMDARFAAQERWITARFDRLEGEIDGLAQNTGERFNAVEARFDELEERLTLAGI